MAKQDEQNLGPENVSGKTTPEMVQVPAGVLEKIQSELDTLRQAVNQNKLVEIENRNKPKELARVFLKVFMGKPVVAWKSEKNEYVYIPGQQSPAGEILKARFFFLDGTDSGIVDQSAFTREDTRLWCSVIEDKGRNMVVQFNKLETNNEDLQRSFVMPTETIEINKNFLNP